MGKRKIAFAKRGARGSAVSGVTRCDLGPGVALYVLPTRKFKTISFKLFVHYPLSDEATRFALMQNVLRRGCRGVPNMRRMSMFLESIYGASFDVDTSKIGERQMGTFSIRAVNDRFAPKRVGVVSKVLEFLADVVSRPVLERGLLRQDYVDQEKVNLKRMLESVINDKLSFALLRCTQIMCAGEPFAEYEYGKLDRVDAISAKDLTEFHDRVVASAPIDLYVLGDINPQEATRCAERSLRRLALRKSALTLPEPVQAAGRPVKEVIERVEVEQAKLILGCRTGITYRDMDYTATAVMNGVLGGFSHSRLFVNVREKEGLCYQASSFIEATKGLLFIILGIDADKYERARNVVERQVEEIRAGRITDDELDKTKKVMITGAKSTEDQPGRKIQAHLEATINGRVHDTEAAIARIRAVTREDVARAARRLQPDLVYLLRRP